MAKYLMYMFGSEDSGNEVVMDLSEEQEKFVIDLAERLNKDHNRYSPYFVVENLDEKKRQYEENKKKEEEAYRAKINHATGNDVKGPSVMEEAFNRAKEKRG